MSQENINFSNAEPQPKTIEGAVAIWDLVKIDIDQRDSFGTKKYGQRLLSNDGRNSIIDAYQEALDLVVYLRKFIYEQSGK